MKRTVLITGITGDIGSAIALKFAQEGWNIIGHYCSAEEKKNKLVARLKPFKGAIIMLKADFADANQVQTLIKAVQKVRVDALINNAGSVVEKCDIEQLTYEKMFAVFSLNTFAPFLITAAIFKQMKKQRYGRIVNISSISAKFGGSLQTASYAASKLALEGLTKLFSREGAAHNILVNTLRPGVIATGFHRKFPKNVAQRLKLIPLKKMGQPPEIAKFVFMMVDNDYMTNETLTVAGGE